MKCDQAKTLMHDYISDELDTVSQKELSEHLNGCADCQQELDQLEQYKACMSSFKTPTLEPGRAAHLLRRVAQQAEHEQHHKASRYAFVKGFAAASVMAIALTLGLHQTGTLTGTTDDAYVANYGVDAQEIALTIHAPFDMQGATLILNLPADVSIQGQEHLATVKWAVDLKAGSNRIVLPVQFEPFAEFATELMLSASLIYQNDQKDFTVDLAQEAAAEHGAILNKAPASRPV